MGGIITSRPIMFIGIQQYDIASIWSPRQGNDLWLHGQGKGGLITSQPYHFCKIPVGNAVSSGHQAKAVSSSQTLK